MLRPAAVMVAALLLAGCVPNEPVVTPPPEPQATPIFASDEDALAAATKAYAKYLEVSDAILHDGGANPDRISEFVTSEQLTHELAGFKEWSTPHDQSKGSTRFDTISLQQYSDEQGKFATISIYLCIDLSSVQVLNSTGTDITPGSRINRYPLEVALTTTDNRQLLISRSEPWSGKNFC